MPTTDARQLLRHRYVADNAKRKESVEAERLNARIARMIHDFRKDAGLSQRQLAELVDTTQSVISRLEDADYEGHSLVMLRRIAASLNAKLIISLERKQNS